MSTPSSCQPVIVVHGGAWSIPDSLAEASVEGVKRAVQEGYRVLSHGGTALEAVQAAIIVLEDDPAFNAGTGSVLNAQGDIEMDAILIDGERRNFGAVAGVSDIKHPIQLARCILEKTGERFYIGAEGTALAIEEKLTSATPDELVTPHARKEWEDFMTYNKVIGSCFKSSPGKFHGHDTVGAVAIDCLGNMACGTSTGGITAKMPGRVGDSPLVGSGAYCDNGIGGISTTGDGEAMTKVCLAKSIAQLLDKGVAAQTAAKQCLLSMLSRVQGTGGAIVLSHRGEVGVYFTTERMAWAYMKDEHMTFGLHPGQEGIGVPFSDVRVPCRTVLNKTNQEPVVITHCGAGLSSSAGQQLGSQKSAHVGYNVLMSGGSAVDAAVACVIDMESNPFLNAGFGSSLRCDGSVEMEAMVMDGRDLSVGSVAGVRRLKHPIEVAKSVMEKTEHTMIVGKGANDFGEEMDLALTTQDQLVTEVAYEQIVKHSKEAEHPETNRLARPKGKMYGFQDMATELSVLSHHYHVTSNTESTVEPGTFGVGAIVMDARGNVACAISSGGVIGSKPGTLCSTAIIGCGGYADNRRGAVTTCGREEDICSTVLAKHILEQLGGNEAPQNSSQVSDEFSTFSSGVVALNSHTGEYFIHCHTDWGVIAWTAITNGTVHHGVKNGDINSVGAYLYK